jgi:CHAD domain-containing protein
LVDRTLHLEASAETTEESVHVELKRLGYRFRSLSPKEETRIYFDTQGGSLFKQGFELYLSPDDSRWHLLREGREVHAQKGTRDAPPDSGPIARSLQSVTHVFPCVPYLEATLKETVLSLASISAPPLGLAIRVWQLHSPLHHASPRTALTLSLDRQRASSFELDYLAGLLREALDVRELEGLDLQFGLTRLGVPLPGAPLPCDFSPADGDDTAVVCRKILSGEAWRMKANTPGAVLDLDPEFVHDLRVATRRARFACRVFVGVLGQKDRDTIRAELSWIAGLLGRVRDLDVLAGRLPSWFHLADTDPTFQAAVAGVLGARRTQARALLVPALHSPRYAALLELMSSAATTSSGNEMTDVPGGRQSADEFGSRRIGKALGRIAPWAQRNPEELSPVELHRLRILFKRLRYTAEFFRPILGEVVASLAKECVVYQDCLGMHQDARVAIEVLTGLAEEPALYEQVGGLIALGALIQIQRDIMRAQRDRFRSLWGSVEGLFDLWAGRVPEVRP